MERTDLETMCGSFVFVAIERSIPHFRKRMLSAFKRMSSTIASLKIPQISQRMSVNFIKQLEPSRRFRTNFEYRREGGSHYCQVYHRRGVDNVEGIDFEHCSWQSVWPTP